MVFSGVARMFGLMLMAAALCAVLGGCASNVGTSTANQSGSQMRYYGGPKYPMWPSQ
jgi:uncharacterized protein YceK